MPYFKVAIVENDGFDSGAENITEAKLQATIDELFINDVALYDNAVGYTKTTDTADLKVYTKLKATVTISRYQMKTIKWASVIEEPKTKEVRVCSNPPMETPQSAFRLLSLYEKLNTRRDA